MQKLKFFKIRNFIFNCKIKSHIIHLDFNSIQSNLVRIIHAGHHLEEQIINANVNPCRLKNSKIKNMLIMRALCTSLQHPDLSIFQTPIR